MSIRNENRAIRNPMTINRIAADSFEVIDPSKPAKERSLGFANTFVVAELAVLCQQRTFELGHALAENQELTRKVAMLESEVSRLKGRF